MVYIAAGTYTRPATRKEAASFITRLERIQHQVKIREFERIAKQVPELAEDDGLVLREGFAFRRGDPALEASDRKAPPREKRPPATRISSSTGCSLRLELAMLALTQTIRRAGAKARLSDLDFDVAGSRDRRAWSDLVTTGAVPSQRNVFISSADKRARSVREALSRLDEAGLVQVPRTSNGQLHFKNFVLLDERGPGSGGDNDEYRTPSDHDSSDVTFTLPPGFISQAWVHALEDSEIALILMLACGRNALKDGDRMAFSGADRLRHYGIHRDPYSRARKTLELFGLLDVQEVERHGDGRAVDSAFYLHRFRLVPERFAEPATPIITATLEEQITRTAALSAARARRSKPPHVPR